MFNVSADILVLAAVRLVGAEEVCAIVYENKSFRIDPLVFLVGYFHSFPQ